VPKRDGILTPTQYQALEKVVTLAFAQRRKVLRNNLSTIKDQLGIDDETLALRAQDVTLDQYLIWARKLAGQ
jgi:16S rRNA (adenine1518-N6/adenine1519-N6)-dimethyltransferase